MLLKLLGTVAFLGILFQVGHFAEHLFQFGIWVLGDLSQICGRNQAWLSDVAKDLVAFIGSNFHEGRAKLMGVEVLHLLGNAIFLTSLLALYACIGTKWVRWACYVEGFHLYEHIMLTFTSYFLGHPVGLSTLFGAVIDMPPEARVGIRVSWHFVMNLLPMPFAMIGIMAWLREKREWERYRNAPVNWPEIFAGNPDHFPQITHRSVPSSLRGH